MACCRVLFMGRRLYFGCGQQGSGDLFASPIFAGSFRWNSFQLLCWCVQAETVLRLRNMQKAEGPAADVGRPLAIFGGRRAAQSDCRLQFQK